MGHPRSPARHTLQVDGRRRPPLHRHTRPAGTGEPEIPYVVGEWDFDLDDRLSTDNAFRGVTVYGVTEHVEADDENRPVRGARDVIEDEVGNFMLREVFEPWDLR
jgi:hypothetical protein